MGIHFGTFAQADDGEFEPIKDLQEALKESKVNSEEFFVPDFVKAYQFGLKKVAAKWGKFPICWLRESYKNWIPSKN